jgi:hypothetical protein
MLKRMVFFLGLMALLGCGTVPAAAPNTLSGLGAGKVFFNVTQPPAKVELRYRPQYGWDEPISLFGPDGRLMARYRWGHRSTGNQSLRLDRGAGIYVLLLKPSYSFDITASGSGMVFAPDGQGPALVRNHGRQRLFFRVPEGTDRFSLAFTNTFNLKGRRSRLTLFDPTGKQAAR